MKQLTVSLKKKDRRDIKYVLGEVAKAIDEGFNSGIEDPVNWGLRNIKDINNNIESIQNQIRDLRDGDGHFCPAVENEDDKCSCGKYDDIIDSLENWKLNNK